jgi:hypothetical protein
MIEFSYEKRRMQEKYSESFTWKTIKVKALFESEGEIQ